jgi:hypothetical protein
VVIWYILWSFGTFCGHLVHFVVIWYILWSFGTFFGHLVYFSPFWYVVSRNNLATLLESEKVGIFQCSRKQNPKLLHHFWRAALYSNRIETDSENVKNFLVRTMFSVENKTFRDFFSFLKKNWS